MIEKTVPNFYMAMSTVLYAVVDIYTSVYISLFISASLTDEQVPIGAHRFIEIQIDPLGQCTLGDQSGSNAKLGRTSLAFDGTGPSG